MPDLIINEIFHSIQGESTRMGCPCTFVRLTGCNLRCVWCDTVSAFQEGRPMSVAQILKEVERYPARMVEITGGEPLLQDGVFNLMEALCDRGYETLLETSGSVDISRVDRRVVRIMDLKCPGSGMAQKNFWPNILQLRAADEVKFVIRDRADFDWAQERIREHDLLRRCPVLMSPVFGELEPVRLAEWILECAPGVRLQLQMHKVLWEPMTRGV